MDESRNEPRYKEIYGYRAQYARMLRSLKLAKTQSDQLVEKEYQLITFFLHCWHLKDHIRNDNSLPEDVRIKIVERAHSSPELQICRDLANGLKHFSRKSAEIVGNVSVTVYVGRGAAYYPMVTYENGAQERAVDVAIAAAKAWETILSDEIIDFDHSDLTDI